VFSGIGVGFVSPSLAALALSRQIGGSGGVLDIKLKQCTSFLSNVTISRSKSSDTRSGSTRDSRLVFMVSSICS